MEKIIKKNSNSHFVRDIFFVALGIAAAGFGLKGFLLPNSFIDGGAMGIALLISETTFIPLSLLIVATNLPFIILGYAQIGRAFAIKSILAILVLAIVVHFVPYPLITSDKLLIAVFGGFFLGAGIGLTIRGGAVIDGTEVLAIHLSKKLGITIGDIILIFNIIIFSFAAYVLSVEVALYAVLTYLVASKTINYIIEGSEEYIGITVISAKSEEIRLMITAKMGRGATIYLGKGGYSENRGDLSSIDIVYTVITRLEITKLRTEIEAIDEKAFIIMNNINDIKGGIVEQLGA